MSVLKHHGIRGLAKRGDTPQYVEEDAQAYTQAELDALLKVCNPDQSLLYRFYLSSGFRMQEVMHVAFSVCFLWDWQLRRSWRFLLLGKDRYLSHSRLNWAEIVLFFRSRRRTSRPQKFDCPTGILA